MSQIIEFLRDVSQGERIFIYILAMVVLVSLFESISKVFRKKKK